MTAKPTKRNTGSQLPMNAGATKLTDALLEGLPQVAHYFWRAYGEFDRLLVKARGENDVIVVCKRYGPDGKVQVVFGSGHDVVSALLALEGSIAAEKWRDDVWEPSNKK